MVFWWGGGVPLSRVLSPALAVEVVPARDAGPTVEAGVGGAGADSDFAVRSHERGAALTEVACRDVTKRINQSFKFTQRYRPKNTLKL